MIQTAYAYIKSRRAFKDPTQLQRFLVLFLDKENKPTGRMIPYEYWWNAPYKAARSKGLIRKSSFGLVFGAKTRATDKDFFWYLTPKGEEAATAAREYIDGYQKEIVRLSEEWRTLVRNSTDHGRSS